MTNAVRTALAEARQRVVEEPAAAEAIARAAEGQALELGDERGRVLALALRGSAALQRGELDVAHRVAALLRTAGPRKTDAEVEVEVAVFRADLAFFTAAYRDALVHAEIAVTTADETGWTWLRLYARRRVCIVLGNLDDPSWPAQLAVMHELCLATQELWELAATHNDLASLALAGGDLAEARDELDKARAVAGRTKRPKQLLLTVLDVTEAEVRLAAGDAEAAVDLALAARARLAETATPSPYLLAATLLVQVKALIAAGRAEAAHAAAQDGLAVLGDRTPQARAALLRELAGALRGAGQLEAAYDTLSEAAELERVAFREFTEMQADVERAIAEGTAARLEAEALREAAERDPLTGLHNRRHLARVVAAVTPGDPVGVAAIDLDHFKTVNDRFGHDVGDQVLVRAAELLRTTARASDVVARTGGEEFVVLMPGADIAAAGTLAERLRLVVADEPWSEIAADLALTTSVGVVSDTDGVEGLLAQADARLYAAKRAGRNRVVAD